ncbi:MAG: PfkB family carbohydrate kinase [Minicystis sp.]
MLDVLCLGEALWDLYAPRGQPFAQAAKLALVPGGAAVNVALHLTKLGLRAGLCAVVGDDALGQALIARVAAAGVDCAQVSSAPPRTGLVFVERAGEARHVVGYRASDERAPLVPREIGARALFLTGVTPDAGQLAGFLQAARRARRQRVTVVLDVNARPRRWVGRDASALIPLLREADLLRCSTDDLAALGLAIGTIEASMRAKATLIVSDGAGVTRALGPFGRVERAPRAARVQDPTGAGDALTAGILAALLEEGEGGDEPRSGASWARAIDRGHALSRAHLTRRGR